MARRSPVPLIVAVVVAVALVVGVRVFAGGGSQRPADCILLNIAASTEKYALLTEIMEKYRKQGRTVAGRCVDVEVHEMSSGAAAQALLDGWNETEDGSPPDVWSPAASAWPDLLQQRLSAAKKPDVVPLERPSIAKSPLVVAMPQPMAEALGWPKDEISWNELFKLAGDPAGWRAKMHPEWGPFKFGKTNPNLSTSGLDATVAAFGAAAGRFSELSVDDVKADANRNFVRTAEGSVVHYGDTTLTFLQNLYDADKAKQALAYISAVAVEEKSVWDYNQGNPSGDPATRGTQPPPSVKLVAIYPRDGTLMSDNPFLTLNAPWVDQAKRAAATDVFAFLREPEQQERFQAAAFRNFDGAPGAPINQDNGMLPDRFIRVLTPPSGEVLDRIVNDWSDLRKRANIAFVLDVSRSMGQTVREAGRTRLQLAKTAAEMGLGLLGPEDSLSLWAFSSPSAGESLPYRKLVTSRQVGSDRSAYLQALEQLQPNGETALYATTRAAVAEIAKTYDPERINAVVVLTDGINAYPPDQDLDGLERDLGNQPRDRTVRVFAIGYGPDVNLEQLDGIAKASKGAAYDAKHPTSIENVMVNVISNF